MSACQEGRWQGFNSGTWLFKTLLSALDLPNQCIQSIEEPGPVLRPKGRRPAADKPLGTQIPHQLPGGEGTADIGIGKRLAGGREHPRTALDTLRGKGDIRRDDNVIPGYVLDNPLVGRIELIAYHDKPNRRLIGNAHP